MKGVIVKLTAVLSLCGIISILPCVQAEDNFKCQVCRAVVDEALFQISEVDPTRTVQMGSFRIDSNGNHGRYEVPYARSETHLTELFEEFCRRLNNYGETTVDGRKSIIRQSAKDGSPVSLDNIIVDNDRRKTMISTCEVLFEDFEDDMMVILRNKDVPDDITERTICLEITDYCSDEDLQYPVPQPKVQDADSVMKEIEKRMAETAPRRAEPVEEDSDTHTDEQADDAGDTDTKTEL